MVNYTEQRNRILFYWGIYSPLSLLKGIIDMNSTKTIANLYTPNKIKKAMADTKEKTATKQRQTPKQKQKG